MCQISPTHAPVLLCCPSSLPRVTIDLAPLSFALILCCIWARLHLVRYLLLGLLSPTPTCAAPQEYLIAGSIAVRNICPVAVSCCA
jgi:hypothetical protein